MIILNYDYLIINIHYSITIFVLYFIGCINFFFNIFINNKFTVTSKNFLLYPMSQIFKCTSVFLLPIKYTFVILVLKCTLVLRF